MWHTPSCRILATGLQVKHKCHLRVKGGETGAMRQVSPAVLMAELGLELDSGLHLS